MPTLRFRMGDADREKYEGPEWCQFDSDALDDLDYDLQVQIEETLDYSLDEIGEDLQRRKAKVLRAVMWIGRWQNGWIDDWKQFKPRIRLVQWEVAEANPPVPATRANPDTDTNEPGA